MKTEEVLKRYAEGEREFPALNLNETNLCGVNLSKANLSGANLSVANLSGANLSGANLSKAKLNVTKLSGANLSKANLTEANLNVANLTLADLSEADLSQASLVRAELVRADLSGANLNRVNISGADLKDAKLRHANLAYANLSRADLKWTVFTAANLTQANLHGADLSSADFTSADLSDTELRQANLSRTTLRGANLSGANLRWADLSGADLSWADLSGAKLSGANLTGANLSSANLANASLVHVDLTRANLIGADWVGSDLSGSTLTGAKLHGVLRFGVKTEGLICEWIDLSPNGDQSNIQRLSPETLRTFFHEAPPTVCILIDATLDLEAHYILARTYHQIAKHFSIPFIPPNIQMGRRRTTLTFEMDSDDHLFLTAFVSMLPFVDAIAARTSMTALLKRVAQLIQSVELTNGLTDLARFQTLNAQLSDLPAKLNELTLSDGSIATLKRIRFFQAPTRLTLVNSSGHSLPIYCNPAFGKRIVDRPDHASASEPTSPPAFSDLSLFGSLAEFVQGLHFTDNTEPL